MPKEPETALAPEQAAGIVSNWVIPFLDNDETIGDFLLLLRSLAYQDDDTTRENIYIAVESQLTPFVACLSAPLNNLIARRLKVARGEGPRKKGGAR